MKRLLIALARLNRGRPAHSVLVLSVTVATAGSFALAAQTITTLHTFDGTDGASSVAGLVQGADGNLYGVTGYGGANCLANNGPGCGTVFKITPSGTLTTLYSFCAQSGCTDGATPTAALVLGTDGDFYGTTGYGGAHGNFTGTVFKITPRGALTTLYSFCAQSGCTDGSTPWGPLIQAADGDFYGTTWFGGTHGEGTIFKITPGGTLTTLYDFCSHGAYPDCTDGYQAMALVQAPNGDFYGTTGVGGDSNGGGTVFKMTPAGTLTTLYNFCSQINCTDGSSPQAGLVLAANGDFYGTTHSFGSLNGYEGTVFKITPAGTMTTLYTFCSQSGCADGETPMAGLIQATNGDFYGTTMKGGANGGGTVFEITPNGTLTTLYSFCSQSACADGNGPMAGLIQNTNGMLYGMTPGGGANGDGTVFSLSAGLGPFVKTQPAFGKVGAVVRILGTNLTGVSSVTFNGSQAAFGVSSSSPLTEIAAIVPAGATTGKVEVVTPRGTLSSHVVFQVK